MELMMDSQWICGGRSFNSHSSGYSSHPHLQGLGKEPRLILIPIRILHPEGQTFQLRGHMTST